MASQSLTLYLERLQSDDALRHLRQSLLPVTLTPAVLLPDRSNYRPQGEPLMVDGFLDHFSPAEESGPLVRHSAAAVVAQAGSGKSALLQALMWELSQRALASESAPLPFYLPLERLGEGMEGLLIGALWRVGLPISRLALGGLLRESARAPFFLLDPSPAFATSGAAEALDRLIREAETQWPGCRWIIALRPDTALALPEGWHERRFYLLDPLPEEAARTHLMQGLNRPIQNALAHLLEQVPALASLIRRPAYADLLRTVATNAPSSDVRHWAQRFVRALEERAGVAAPRAKQLPLLHALAMADEGLALDGDPITDGAARGLVSLREAGLVDVLPAGNGTPARARLAEPALRELIQWLDGAVAPSRKSVPDEPEPRPADMPPPTALLEGWESSIASNELDKLLHLQQQLDGMRAETLHQIALTHRDASRLEEAESHARQALTLRPGHAPYRVTLGTVGALAGRHDEARRILEEALPHAPTGGGYFHLGHCYESLGWVTEAFQAFQQAAKLPSPQQAEAAAAAALSAPDTATSARHWEQALALNPARAEWHVSLGRLRETLGDPDEAQQCYRRALEAHPNEAEAHYRLGCLLRLAGEQALALNHLQRATTLHPRIADWFVELGRALEAVNDPAAENAYRHAIRLAPHTPLPFGALGALLRRLNRLDEAHAALKQSLALDGEQVDVLFELGLLCEAQGDVGQALAAYRRAARLDATSPQVRSQLGAVHRSLGQAQEARHWLEEALELNPHHGPAYEELGHLAESEGAWEEASHLYRTALREMPENVQVRFRAAVMFMRLEQPAEAIALLEGTAQAMPDNAEVQWHLAEALRLEGRPVEALAAYRSTTRLSPEHAGYHLALAHHARTMGRLDEAQRAVERALELDERAVEGHSFAAQLAVERREPSRALASLRRAIDLDPHDATLYQRVAAIYRAQGQADEALDYLTQAIELVGEIAPLLAEAAALHEGRNDRRAAIALLDRALKVDGQQLAYRQQRARLLFAEGEGERARRDWEIVLRVNPACGEAHFGLGRLLLAEGRQDNALRALRARHRGGGYSRCLAAGAWATCRRAWAGGSGARLAGQS